MVDPSKLPLTDEMLDEAVEAFLTRHAAGAINEHGERGTRRDVRAAIEAALSADSRAPRNKQHSEEGS